MKQVILKGFITFPHKKGILIICRIGPNFSISGDLKIPYFFEPFTLTTDFSMIIFSIIVFHSFSIIFASMTMKSLLTN